MYCRSCDNNIFAHVDITFYCRKIAKTEHSSMEAYAGVRGQLIEVQKCFSEEK